MQRQNQVKKNDLSGNSASREENRAGQELGTAHGKPHDESAALDAASQKRDVMPDARQAQSTGSHADNAQSPQDTDNKAERQPKGSHRG